MKTNRLPAEIFRTNLQGLIDKTGARLIDIERSSITPHGPKVSARMVRYILDGERKPTVDTAEAIGHAFGLNGWQMLLPNLLNDMNNSKQLDLLVDLYIDSPEEGKNYILRVAEKEAEYKK